MKNYKNNTKAELRAFLESYADVVKEKSLKDRIAYTLKKYGESTKKTVIDLLGDIESNLETAQPLPVENSTKPKLSKGKAKSETKTAKTADKVADAPKPVKTEAKPKSKKPTAKKDAVSKLSDEELKVVDDIFKGKNVEVKPNKPEKQTAKKGAKKPSLKKPKSTTGATEKSAPMAAIFPEKIEDENIGTLVAVPDKYHNIKELREAVESGEKTIVICAYFPIPLVKKYGYADTPECNKRVPKNGFNHDLDIQQVIYACEGLPRVYAMSDYTEAMFYYDDDMLTPVETKDNATGETVKTRFANGCEFEIYELAEDAE